MTRRGIDGVIKALLATAVLVGMPLLLVGGPILQGNTLLLTIGLVFFAGSLCLAALLVVLDS